MSSNVVSARFMTVAQVGRLKRGHPVLGLDCNSYVSMDFVPEIIWWHEDEITPRAFSIRLMNF